MGTLQYLLQRSQFCNSDMHWVTRRERRGRRPSLLHHPRQDLRDDAPGFTSRSSRHAALTGDPAL